MSANDDTARALFAGVADRVACPDRVFERLVGCYLEPHRRYHTLAHIVEMLECLEQSETLAADRAAVALAVWFHDAVYEVPSAPGCNEERSAALLESVSIGSSGGQAARMIRHSAHHGPSEDPDIRLFCDLDLYRLGVPTADFARHGADIRFEYGYLSDADWRCGRAGFLRKILARPAIFQTALWHERCERQARENISLEIEALEN